MHGAAQLSTAGWPGGCGAEVQVRPPLVVRTMAGQIAALPSRQSEVPRIQPSLVPTNVESTAWKCESPDPVSMRTCVATGSEPRRAAVLGAEGAVNIVYRKQLKTAPDPEAERARLVAEFAEKFGTPFRAAASGHIDDVIKPSETRPRLIAALETLKNKRVTGLRKKHGNMPV